MMKTILLALLLFHVVFFSSQQVIAQEVIKKQESHNVFKGLFYSVWSRLRSINPHQRHSAKARVVYTAGIRGAESTETLIQPYWKGDLSQDPLFQAELKLFTTAQQKMDKGDLVESVKLFDVFIDKYVSSSLLPNAILAKGVSLAGLGNNVEARANLKQFVTDNPSHPLVLEVKQMLDQLN